MIQGSCGHKLTSEWMKSGKGIVKVKDWTSDTEGFKRCITHLIVCPECLKWYRKKRLTTNQPEKWLNKDQTKEVED